MKKLLLRLWREQDGQDLVEYALLLVLLSLVAVASIRGAGQAVNNTFADIGNQLAAT